MAPRRGTRRGAARRLLGVAAALPLLLAARARGAAPPGGGAGEGGVAGDLGDDDEGWRAALGDLRRLEARGPAPPNGRRLLARDDSDDVEPWAGDLGPGARLVAVSPAAGAGPVQGTLRDRRRDGDVDDRAAGYRVVGAWGGGGAALAVASPAGEARLRAAAGVGAVEPLPAAGKVRPASQALALAAALRSDDHAAALAEAG